MTRINVRRAVCLAVAGMAIAAPHAGAEGTLEPVLQPVFFEYSGTQDFANNTGESVEVVYDLSTQARTNDQTLSTSSGGTSASGLTVDHSYSRADDQGSYSAGADGTRTELNRSDSTFTTSTSGSVAGEPVDTGTTEIKLLQRLGL